MEHAMVVVSPLRRSVSRWLTTAVQGRAGGTRGDIMTIHGVHYGP